VRDRLDEVNNMVESSGYPNGNMTLKASAYLTPYGVEPYSDIESCRYEDGAFNVVLACSLDAGKNVVGMSLKFTNVTGFRLLDELDLARYWLSNKFERGSYLLEVSDGGWAAEETELQGFRNPRREWLVVTGNGCASVFSNAAPEITPLTWPLSGD
jgi:hypothetical protein